MSQDQTAKTDRKDMRTFGQLKVEVLAVASANDHFELIRLSAAHRNFWERMNRMEYDRGYVHEEYIKPGSPCLCDMELLDQPEYDRLLNEFKTMHESYLQSLPTS